MIDVTLIRHVADGLLLIIDQTRVGSSSIGPACMANASFILSGLILQIMISGPGCPASGPGCPASGPGCSASGPGCSGDSSLCL
jgi:hypothetical protein